MELARDLEGTWTREATMEIDERERLGQALRRGDVESVAKRLGFDLVGTPVRGVALRAWGLEPASIEQAGQLCVLAAGEGFRLMHIDGEALRGRSCWRAVRRVMMAVEEAAPQMAYLWWWTTAQDWTAAVVDGGWSMGGEEEQALGRRRVKKLVIDVDHPDEAGLSQWLSFGIGSRVDRPDVLSVDAWRAHFNEILDQDGVTREFFARFSQGLDELAASMKQGPEDERLRHEVALSTLLRVLFLYFLQARGALDSDRRFVMRRFVENSSDERREMSFYRAVLRPLFFGALNCPHGRREASARALGDLPFLNGGLFEESAVEEAYAELDWDDDIWRGLLNELFERHRFAVEWCDEEDLSRAVDPEMLGKVFEGLMYGDRRNRSGSFYTPREVVRSMVRRSLTRWLAEKAEMDEKAIEVLIDGEAYKLSAGKRRRVREALASLTVLDPAVGTGAFLLEVLRVLRRVDRGLDEAEGVIRTAGERYERMRALVHDHLFGVDVQPTAVRLCELRIWLAMLAALPELPAGEMPPLPNLSHRLCTGNSLVAPLDWVRYRVDGARSAAAISRDPSRFERRNVERLVVLHSAYTRAHGEEKRELKKALESTQQDVQRHLIRGRIARINEAIEPLEALKGSKDLFGAPATLDGGQRATLEGLSREREALTEALHDLEASRREVAGFSFDAHFAPVMACGGFEIVITNPPWVRSTHLDRATRRLYSARFVSDDHRLWPGAKRMGVRATFGAQVDMAALFLERSIELLRPGGHLCALVPVKLFRSLHGAGLRGVLAQHRLEYIEDRSEIEEALFDATTYPAVIGLRKQEAAPAPKPVEVSLWRRGSRRCFDMPLRNLCAFGEDLREPWMMVEPEVERIFRKMQESSLPLGEVEELPIRRGVMTGHNAAFLVEPREAAQRFSPVVRDRFLRWAVQGRDVDGDSVRRRRQIIWPVDEHGEVLRRLPAELEEHFEAFRASLLRRSDYRRGRPLWDLFRRHDDIQRPGVVWRDLAPELQAAPIGGDSIPLNTVYYLPTVDEVQAEAMIALFHSEAVRAIAFALGERARGGWRRHFAWVMRMLPLPRRWLGLWREGRAAELVDEEKISGMFGLHEEEVQRLAAWRRGWQQERRREVA